MRITSKSRSCLSAAAFALVASTAGQALAAPCPKNLPNSIYGGGGSAVTPTLGKIAARLSTLNQADNGADPIHIFYADPSACTGYDYLANPSKGKPTTFKYWVDGNSTPIVCEADGTEEFTFGHMGNTPKLCSGQQDVDAAEKPTGRFVWPVQSINFITDFDSAQHSISAEAIYHIFGLGAANGGVAPWTQPAATFSRSATSFVHLIIAGAVGVPATNFKVPNGNVLSTNDLTVQYVYEWQEGNPDRGVAAGGDPNQPLGYVSGSNADAGEEAGRVKTLAYKHYDQSCGYLPDSDRGKKDKLNVRNGQYALWTPAWLYARVDEAGRPTDPNVERLIRYVDGTLASPRGANIVDEVIASGDVPLCAMNAIRPEGDLSAIQSFAPSEPCHGYFDFKTSGSSSLTSCEDDDDCSGKEKCRGFETLVVEEEGEEPVEKFVGFCEAY